MFDFKFQYLDIKYTTIQELLNNCSVLNRNLRKYWRYAYCSFGYNIYCLLSYHYQYPGFLSVIYWDMLVFGRSQTNDMILVVIITYKK